MAVFHSAFATVETYFEANHPLYGKIVIEGTNYSPENSLPLKKLYAQLVAGQMTWEQFDIAAWKYQAIRRGGPPISEAARQKMFAKTVSTPPASSHEPSGDRRGSLPEVINFGPEIGKTYTGGDKGSGEKGGEYPVVSVDLAGLQPDDNVRYVWRFVRVDPPGNAREDATGSIVKIYLQKLHEGKLVDEALVGQWKNETGNIIDIGAPKHVQWHPELDEELSRIGVSPTFSAPLKKEVRERLNDERTIMLFMFPKPFETLALPQKFEFPPLVEVGLAVIALATPEKEETARESLRKGGTPAVERFEAQVRQSIPLMVAQVMTLKDHQDRGIVEAPESVAPERARGSGLPTAGLPDQGSRTQLDRIHTAYRLRRGLFRGVFLGALPAAALVGLANFLSGNPAVTPSEALLYSTALGAILTAPAELFRRRMRDPERLNRVTPFKLGAACGLTAGAIVSACAAVLSCLH